MIQASGALILPGAIDAQVHSLSQKNQEDFIWSTRSAAAGGVTTIVDMPYDEGNLVCSAEAVSHDNMFSTVLGMVDVTTEAKDAALDLAGACRPATTACGPAGT